MKLFRTMPMFYEEKEKETMKIGMSNEEIEKKDPIHEFINKLDIKNNDCSIF